MKRSNIRKAMRSFMSLLMVVVLLATTLSSNSVLTQAAQENLSENKGNASHIDIGVSASASVTVGGTTYSNSNIGISSSDFTADTMTITAVQGDTTLVGSSNSSAWNRTGNSGNYTYTIRSSGVDFVYNFSDLSTSSGSSNITQVRLGGCFPVGTIDNPVEYTVTLVKEVTLYANGDTSSSDTITVTVTLTATFGYWDEDNDCPGLGGNWSSGNFSNGSGFDFVLSVSSTTRPTVTVYKYVVDEDYNLLTEASGETFGYTITSSNGTTSSTEDGTVTVGSSGLGMATTDVLDNENYTIVEDEDSIPETIGEYSYITNEIEYDYDNHTATIYNIYGINTTDVSVTKVWEDDSNTDYRPDEITVNLLADGSQAKDDSGNDITATLNSANNWTYTFTDLPMYSNGVEIAYSVEEVAVDGYTNGVITGDATSGYTITNTLNVGQLALTKTVNDPDDAADATTFTFLVSGFDTSVTSISDSNGNEYSVVDGVATVLVPENTTVTLVYVPVGTYTVTEYGAATDSDGNITATVNTYTWTVDVEGVDGDTATAAVTAGQTATVEITNTITGTATVVLTKVWDDLSNYWSTRPDSIEITLTAVNDSGDTYVDSAGNTYIYPITAWSGTGDTWTYSLAGVAAYDVDGNKLTYIVTETSVDGYTTTYTYEDENGNDTDAGLTPADNVNATITNALNTGTVTVKKVVLGTDGNEVTSSEENDDDFRFVLYEEDKTTIAGSSTLTLTTSSTTGMQATFSDLPLEIYYLKEELINDNVHAYTVTVEVGGTTITADDDGFYKIDLSDAEDGAAISVTVTNQEQEIGITLPSVTKTYTSDEINTSEETTFTFYVMDSSGVVVATGTATTSVGASAAASVTWTYADGTFTYTEVGTYVYTIHEYNSMAAGVTYDDTVYTLVVTVTTDTDGKLTASYKVYTAYYGEDSSSNVEATGGVSFENTYDPSSVNFFMIVQKVLTGRTITEAEFSVNLQEYTYDEITDTYAIEGDAITVYNSADSTFSHTFAFDAEGTYYYKAQENKGTETGMTYDSKTSWIKIVVGSESGVLKITSVYWVQFDTDTTPDANTVWTEYSGGLSDYVAFQNTYEASGTAELSVIKVLQGRQFVEGETFTFLVTPDETNAPKLTAADGNDDVTIVENADGTYTVTVKVTSDGAESADGSNYSLSWLLGILELDESHIGGSYTYSIYEISASNDNGMTLDTATYGHLVTVTVTDAGNGKLNYSVSSTNDTDWNGDNVTDTTKSVIVNSFSQGSTNIYGAKTWVDGGATHDNTTEVELTLYYSTDGGTTWTAWALNSDNTTYSIDGEGSYAVEWGTLNTSRWRILGLPEYDSTGAAYTYKVEETAIDGYVTTYSNDSTVYYSDVYNDTDRFTITNTIEQENIKLYGTKTWVDDVVDENHDNATEITLIVTRNSDSTELTTLTEVDYPGTGAANTYIVVWNGDDYAIYWYYDATDGYVGLEKYDAAGYEYFYNVAEDAIPGTSYSGESFTYETETEFYFDADGYSVFDFTNRQPDDVPTDPTKDVDVDSMDGLNYGDDGEKVSVGDTVTYIIRYYNNTNTEADVTITDVLDNGVTYVSSSPEGDLTGEHSDGTASDGSTFSYGGTVTWTIEDVAPFTDGYVTLTVTVNENAKSHDTGESGADIDNQATVVVAGNSAETNLVTNPLEDDDPEDPVKSIMRVDSASGDTKTDSDSNDNIIVAVGDYVYYTIRVYNHYATGATITITDVLDDGVEFRNATYYSTGGCVYDNTTRTVTWTVNVNAFSYATVTLVVEVTEDAQEAAQTYNAVDPEDPTSDYEDYTYTDMASIANQASIVNSNDVTVTTYTDVPENPLPGKQVYDAKDTTTTIDGDMVGVGDTLTYTIDWINSAKDTDEESITYGEAVAATITITDDLPDGTVYVAESATSAAPEGETAYTVTLTLKDSDGNVLTDTDEDAAKVATIVWTIVAEAGASGNVSFNVKVTDSAVDNTDNAVTNDADVVVAANEYEYSYTTNTTTNYVPEKDVYDASEYVDGSSTNVSIDGELVGLDDVLIYTIDWQNTETTDADITITDDIPDGTDYVYGSATRQANVIGQTSFTVTLYDTEGNELDDTEENAGNVATIVWTFTAEAGISGTVTFEVEVTEGAFELDSIDNTATVAIGENEYSTNTVTNTVPVKEAEVTTQSDVLHEGDEVEYTITFENTAAPSGDATNPTTVTVTDTLVKGISYNEDAVITVDGVEYTDAELTVVTDEDSGQQTLTWVFEELDLGAEVVITFSITVGENAPSRITNQAAVDGHKTNIVISPVPSDDEKNVLDEDNQIIDGGNVSAGDVLTYEISWTNAVKDPTTGEDTGVYAETVTIVDTLPDGITVDTSTISHQGVYEETTDPLTGEVTRTITWTFGSAEEPLDTDEIVRGTVWFEATVTGDESVMENTAIIIAENEYKVSATVYMPLKDVYDAEQYAEAAEDDETDAVSIDGEFVQVGDELSYEVNFTNTAMDGETYVEANVTVTDYIPDGTVYVAGSAASALTAEGTTTKDAATIQYFDETGDEITTVTEENAAEVDYIVWTFSDMPGSATGTVSFNVTVTEDALSNEGYKVTNDATINVGENEYTTNTVTNKVTEKDVYDADDAEQTSIDGQMVSVGSELAYVVYWANTAVDEDSNPAAATITITDPIPDGTEYVAGSAQAYMNGTDVTDDADIVSVTLYNAEGDVIDDTEANAADVASIQWVIAAEADAAGTATFKVTVTEDAVTTETNELNNTATVIVAIGDDPVQEITTNTTTNYVPEKDVYDADAAQQTSINGDAVTVGSELTYEVSFTNVATDDNGDPTDAAVITVTDNIPDGTVYLSGTTTAGVVLSENDTSGKTASEALVTIYYYADTAQTELLAKATYSLSAQAVTAVEYYVDGAAQVAEPDDFADSVKSIRWEFENVEAEADVTVTFDVEVLKEAINNDNYAVTNTATVQIGENDPAVTNEVVNYVDAKDVYDAEAADQTSIDGQIVGVGSELEYVITWTNTATDDEGEPVAATITITDRLPGGTEYVADSVKAYMNGTDVTDEADIATISLLTVNGGTPMDETDTSLIGMIKWVIEADANASGTVSFKVTVTEDAVTTETNELNNTATVSLDDDPVQEITTNTTTNYVPEKDVYDAEQYVDAAASTEDEVEPESIDGEGVEIGDVLTYEITFLNTAQDESGNYVDAETITVTDKIPDGTTYVADSAVAAVDGDVNEVEITLYSGDDILYLIAYDNGTAVWYNSAREELSEIPEDYEDSVTKIEWSLYGVSAEAEVTVTFDVVVNEDAAENNGNAVENTATIVIGEDGPEISTNTVTNYVPEDPAKVELVITAEDETTAEAVAVSTDEDGNVTYQNVSVGDTILYEIDYYNHYAATATVIITDTLDEGLTYVEGSATGTEKSEAGEGAAVVYEVTEDEDGIVTITWTITAEAFEEGCVTFEATVNDTSKLLGENETQATVENDAIVEVGEVSRTTNLVINPLEDDDPDDPEKTISENSPSGYDADAEIVYDDTDDTDAGTLTGDTVGVGSMIEYVISYYNNHSATATVTITDVLDEGVDFLSASGTTEVPGDTSVEAIGYDYVTYSYSEADHTVTWTIYNATAFAYGKVILVVQVNENAKTVDDGETTATVENEATVQIGTDNTADTNIVVNPIDPEDPGDPEKIVAADSAAGVNGAAVAVDDEITYQISYYNHTNAAADITITDVLDPGVEFMSATVADGISYSVTTATDGTVTVIWTITDVTAFTGGYVELVVKVTENALSIESGETTATVENQATVTVGDVENDTNIVINPLADDDPVDPTKTITTEGVAAGDEVAVGDELTYAITYYNHTNEVATVVITDVLDNGVDFVTASDGYKVTTADDGTVTVTWTLTVDPFTAGYVTVTVKVNSDAVTQVENTASVQIGNEEALDTNTVTNPVEEEEEVPVATPTEPETETEPVPITGDTEAVVPYTIMMLLAFMAIVVLLRGRRREQA